MATIGREQAAALLKHRCDLTSFDGEIDDSALKAGSPAACVPILRYIFISFSEALDEFFRESGHTFHEGMSDKQLVAGIMCVWDLLSPHAPLGAATVEKVLQPNAWGTDRLLFTLQCVLLCWRKHRNIVSKSEEKWLQSGLSWTSTNPQQQFGPSHRPLVGTDSERERSTLAWMAEAYREQMATVERTHVDGAAEQQAWVERLLRGGTLERAEPSSESLEDSSGISPSSTTTSCTEDYVSARTSSTRESVTGACTSLRLTGGGGPNRAPLYHEDQPAPDSDTALLTQAAHNVIALQLAEAGMGHLADNGPEAATMNPRPGSRARRAFARHYQGLMQSLRFSGQRRASQASSEGRVSFDDAMLEQAFIPDEPTDDIQKSKDDIRSAENTQQIDKKGLLRHRA